MRKETSRFFLITHYNFPTPSLRKIINVGRDKTGKRPERCMRYRDRISYFESVAGKLENRALEDSQKRESRRYDPSPSASASSPNESWTVTNGFFAWMGGSMLYVDGKPQATLTPDKLLHFVREKNVDMPNITEADIEDRSNGDGLSKGIAILQLVHPARPEPSSNLA
ncbi:hypothetical protein BDR07DRAFT_1489085 [Suillus spraguei]|nr:hypothetical protein BDR07DRAFT_1489085 [Suillus spraguei]